MLARASEDLINLLLPDQPERMRYFDSEFSEARSVIIGKFPGLVNDHGQIKGQCSLTEEQMVDRIAKIVKANDIILTSEFAPAGEYAKAQGLYKGCKRLALFSCVAGCGIVAVVGTGPLALITSLVCGHTCYCGFCHADTNNEALNRDRLRICGDDSG